MMITKRNERWTGREDPIAARRVLGLVVAATVLAGCFPIVGSPARAADRDVSEGEEKRPTVDEVIDRLAEAVDEREAEGIRDALGEFDAAFDELDAVEDERLRERDRERLANAVAKMLDYPRPNENRVAIVAADVLGRMKAVGAERLAWFLSEEDLDEKENRDLRDFALRALGKTRVPEAVPVLTEHLKHHHVSAVVEAANALGRYGEAPGEFRKKIAEPLIRAAEYIDGRLDVHRAREVGRGRIDETWSRAVVPVHEALSAVTGVWKETTSEWRNWYENHKNESWERETSAKSKL